MSWFWIILALVAVYVVAREHGAQEEREARAQREDAGRLPMRLREPNLWALLPKEQQEELERAGR